MTTHRPSTTDRTPPPSEIVALEAVFPGPIAPEGVELRRRPLSAPGRGELLVEVEVTGISAAEKAMRVGRYFGQPAFPFVPGYDLVGSVLSVGPGADPLLVGQRVACLTKTGAWASHAIVSARDSVVVPDTVSSIDAETVIVNGVTAVQMLRQSGVRRGQTVLVQGATSGVGGILVQLAQRAGVRVIGTASVRNHDALHEAGVAPLDYADPQLEARVRELAPGGVDAVFKNVGGHLMHAAWRMLAPGGSLLCYSIMSSRDGTGHPATPHVRALAQVALWNALPNGRRAAFYNIWAGHSTRPARFRARLARDLAELFDLLATGDLTTEVAREFALEDVREAFVFAEARSLPGKVILRP